MTPARSSLALAVLLLAAGLAAPAQSASERKAWTTRDTVARAKPSGFGLALGDLAENTQLTVLEVNGGWTRVSDGKEEGWVRSRALRVEGSDEPPEARVAPVPDEPAELAEPVAAAKPSKPARSTLISPGPPPLPPSPPKGRPLVTRGSLPIAVSAAPELGGSRSVAIGRWQRSPRVLGLRVAPSFGGRMTGALPESSSVRVLERRGDWGLIESRDGRQGWIVLAALDGPLRRRETAYSVARLD